MKFLISYQQSDIIWYRLIGILTDQVQVFGITK